MKELVVKHLRKIIVVLTIIAHMLIIFLVSFSISTNELREDASIFKVVDITEYIPPLPEEKKEKPDESIEITRQDSVANEIIETDKDVVEVDIDYMPQHKISEIPVLPVKEIRSRLVYPSLALRQGIEGVVYLQLYIDQTGYIRKVDVIKDPGFGFAEAALKAVTGMRCVPARANGVPVAVAYRWPIRFQLK